MTDYHTVKNWFAQCRDKAHEIEMQKEKIQRLRALATRTTPNLSGMPGGNGGSDKTATAQCIVDEQRRLQQMETELCILRIEATRRAYCIKACKSSQRQADCLRMYYVENKLQRQIVEELGLHEERQVSIYIRLGCEYLAQIWHEFDDSVQIEQSQC